MTIQERIQSDLKEAITKKDINLREYLKIIVSELQRQKHKVLSDESVVEILRRLENWECDRLAIVGQTGSDYLCTIKSYIPEQVTDEEIEEWINNNIDLSKLKNKFSAIRVILDHFGISTSGNKIKNVLTKM